MIATPSTRVNLGQLARGLGAALVPVVCPGCGYSDTPICRRCAAPFAGPARSSQTLVGGLAPRWRGDRPPAIGVVPYLGTASRTILAWKDHGRRDLTPVMALALGRSVIGSLRGAQLRGALGGSVALVPVPSSRLADARRGGNLVVAAMQGAMNRVDRMAREQQVTVHLEPALKRTRHVRDQAGLSSRQRQENLRDTLGLNDSGRRLRDFDGVVLVDDVLTTGSSLAASARALAAAGMPPVIGAAVVAVTPPGGAGRRAAGSALGENQGTQL